MRFRINKDGERTTLMLTIMVNGTSYSCQFDHHSQSSFEADAMTMFTRDQFEEHITEIRKAAYEAGWRDKTKRYKKRTYFGFCPDSTGPFY